ncbi:trypsin-like serine protease [Micromonospora sp. NPDC050417]|uniref:trypsin-like serine protease n=1 Tax=Micromonospora sp. NPDC050417 TaxID=3364280 RepID=UPI00378E78FF
MFQARKHAGKWLAAFTVVTLASLLAAVPAGAVGGGGAVPDGVYPYLAKIDVGGGGPSGRGCTGALISPQWVATASSCFAVDGESVTVGPPARPTTATVGRTDLTSSTGHVLTVTELVPHPDRNLVLARLSAPITDIAPVAIGSTAPAVGDVLQVAGYGRTATEWLPNRAHVAAFAVTGVGVGVGTLDIQGQAPGQSSPCKGDAGGPALREVAGRVELVALNHLSWQNGCLGETETRQGATETRLDDIGYWVRQRTSEAQSSMPSGECWNCSRSRFLTSPNDHFSLLLQSDGNLVLYVDSIPIWATGTVNGARLANQPDGNVVLYAADGAAVWSTGTFGNGPSTLRLHDDGNLVLYRNSDLAPIWSSGTLRNGSLIRNETGGVAVLAGGAAIWFASPQELAATGYATTPVVPVSTSWAASLPSVPQNGTLIRKNETGGVAVIAGGAAVWFASPEELRDAGYGTTPSIAVPIGWATALPGMPQNGTLIRKNETGGVAVIAGGAAVWFASPEELRNAGYGTTPSIAVPTGWATALPGMPQNGTLIRNNETGGVAVIAGGAAVWFANQDELANAGYGTTPFSTAVPIGWLTALPGMPQNGTLIRNNETGGVAVIAGGAAVWFANQDELANAGYGTTPFSTAVPIGWLTALPGMPQNGTLIRNETGGVAVVAGGAAMWFPNQDELRQAGYGTVPSIGVPTRWTVGLLSKPQDGTLVRSGASPQVWRVDGGIRTAVTPGPTENVTTIGVSSLQAIPVA